MAVVNDLRYWLGLSRVSGIGPSRLRLLVDYFGGAERAWLADPGELRAIGLDRRSIENLYRLRQSLDLDEELARLKRLGIQALTWRDPDYPRLLFQIHDPPPVLYVAGELLPQDDWAVAVVGTRRASAYGREVTRLLVAELAASGVTIVSGLAYGIDGHAHEAAIDAGGRTVAVLGSGLDQIYPRHHFGLARRIMDHGALISEYPPGSKPEAGNFPRRNRIISGLSLGVVVVEAGIRSGALITADYALEQGREVFAVPGSIFLESYQGTNRRIQEGGARLVASAADVLEELNLTMVKDKQQAQVILPENNVEALLLQHLSGEPMHVDDLGRLCALQAAEVATALTLMELKGMVRQVGGMHYVLGGKFVGTTSPG